MAQTFREWLNAKLGFNEADYDPEFLAWFEKRDLWAKMGQRQFKDYFAAAHTGYLIAKGYFR